MAKVCDGTGICLRQDDGGYIKNPNIPCDYKCTLVKCKNHIICGKMRPYWVMAMGNGACPDCTEDGLAIGESVNGTCVDCNNQKMCVRLSTCEHIMCIDDFKSRWYRRENSHSRPPPAMPAKNYGKKFHEWNDEQIAWEKEQDEFFEKQSHLDLCPSCKVNMRKTIQ